MSTSTGQSTGRVPIEVTLRGRVGQYIGEYAQSKVAAALAVVEDRVLSARVVLDVRRSHVHGLDCVEAIVELPGRRITAKASAPTMTEAVDRMEARLRRQLVDARDRERTRSRRP